MVTVINESTTYTPSFHFRSLKIHHNPDRSDVKSYIMKLIDSDLHLIGSIIHLVTEDAPQWQALTRMKPNLLSPTFTAYFGLILYKCYFLFYGMIYLVGI